MGKGSGKYGDVRVAESGKSKGATPDIYACASEGKALSLFEETQCPKEQNIAWVDLVWVAGTKGWKRELESQIKYLGTRESCFSDD